MTMLSGRPAAHIYFGSSGSNWAADGAVTVAAYPAVEMAQKRGTATPLGLSLTSGTALEERNVRHVIRRLLRQAGLRQIRIHDLPHTFAPLLIQQGESVVYVKEQLGHASIQITVDIYGHLIPGANRAAVDRLDDDGAMQPDATRRNPGATRAVR
jgi:hypothetical protein